MRLAEDDDGPEAADTSLCLELVDVLVLPSTAGMACAEAGPSSTAGRFPSATFWESLFIATPFVPEVEWPASTWPGPVGFFGGARSCEEIIAGSTGAPLTPG